MCTVRRRRILQRLTTLHSIAGVLYIKAFGESGALQVLEVRKRGCMMSRVRSILRNGLSRASGEVRAAPQVYNTSVTWEPIVHGG